jgi:hypothetical protein
MDVVLTGVWVLGLLVLALMAGLPLLQAIAERRR